MIRILIMLPLLLVAHMAAAEPLTLTGDFVQGGLIIGQTTKGAAVELNGSPLRVSDTGKFVFGFGRDFKSKARLLVHLPDGTSVTRDLKIKPRVYKTEKLDGIPPSKVTPSQKFLARIRKENGEIARIRAIDTAKSWFESGWVWPVTGRISGVFGSQRVLNGIPKRPHFGLDIAAPRGTDVVASTDGVIRLAKPDLYYTGGTVMIDHGFGLVSVYSHMSKVVAKDGQFVKQGTKIGEVGATGRVTGPHLDWRLNWFKERLDPQLLMGSMSGAH